MNGQKPFTFYMMFKSDFVLGMESRTLQIIKKNKHKPLKT